MVILSPSRIFYFFLYPENKTKAHSQARNWFGSIFLFFYFLHTTIVYVFLRLSSYSCLLNAFNDIAKGFHDYIQRTQAFYKYI